jgi:hypothetical protein
MGRAAMASADLFAAVGVGYQMAGRGAPITAEIESKSTRFRTDRCTNTRR